MVHIVWEFTAREGKVREFEEYYSDSGPWSTLFRKSAGYHGTMLWRDAESARRYMTIDMWDTVASHVAMREQFAAEYDQLDKAGEDLTESERRCGIFE